MKKIERFRKNKRAKSIFFTIFLACAFLPQVFSQRADALVLYRNQQYSAAIEICEQEIAENPKNIDSYSVLCWSLVRNRQYAEAEVRATEAQKIAPYDVRIIEILAESKYYQGKNASAMTLFQQYLSTVPANGARIGNAYYYMGEIYVRQAKYQHADIAFSSAVHTEPSVALWWTRCGFAREMAGNYNLAIAAYDTALKIDSRQSDAARGKERCAQKIQ